MHLVTGKRVVATEQEVLWLPHNWSTGSQATNPYGVVFVHGYGDTAVSPMDISNKLGQFELIETLTDAGLPVLTMDFGQTGVTPGGENGWGNATVVARLATAFTYMTGAPVGAKTGKILLVGVSMGNISAMNYAKANPTKVAGLVGVIPVVDMDDIYQNNRSNLRPSIEAAHGITYPAALPAGSNPATSQGSLSSVPTRLYYSTGDTVIIPSTVTTLATAIGAAAIAHGSLEHSEASIQDIDMVDMAVWMKART